MWVPDYFKLFNRIRILYKCSFPDHMVLMDKCRSIILTKSFRT